MRIILLFGFIFAFLQLSGFSKVVSENELGGVLYAYPYIDSLPSPQTPPPSGYVPFHIEHYARHGSRWMLNADDYDIPVKNLEKAEKANKLTSLGKKTLNYLRSLQKSAKGHLGQLTEKGAFQHRIIGQRIATNFPEIFFPEAYLTAKSTIVTRCIESMNSALDGINEVKPGLTFEINSSQDNLWFMNYKDTPALELRDKVNKNVLDTYRDSIMSDATYLDRLVSDEKFAHEQVEPGLLPRLYWALSSPQNINDDPLILEEVFGHRDLMKNWNYGNARRFLLGGNSSLTKGRMPFSQRFLLGRIIADADSAINNACVGANLRFGHDDVLMPLIVLMELNNFGTEINSFEELEKSGWHDYEITPMAGNLQLVFYHTEYDFDPNEILIKALINEQEVSMPGIPVSGPYYRWIDLRNYYLSKLYSFSFD